jgi:hypothetical protein
VLAKENPAYLLDLRDNNFSYGSPGARNVQRLASAPSAPLRRCSEGRIFVVLPQQGDLRCVHDVRNGVFHVGVSGHQETAFADLVSVLQAVKPLLRALDLPPA